MEQALLSSVLRPSSLRIVAAGSSPEVRRRKVRRNVDWVVSRRMGGPQDMVKLCVSTEQVTQSRWMSRHGLAGPASLSMLSSTTDQRSDRGRAARQSAVTNVGSQDHITCGPVLPQVGDPRSSCWTDGLREGQRNTQISSETEYHPGRKENKHTNRDRETKSPRNSYKGESPTEASEIKDSSRISDPDIRRASFAKFPRSSRRGSPGLRSFKSDRGSYRMSFDRISGRADTSCERAGTR